MSSLTDMLQRPGRTPRRRVLSIIGLVLVPFVIAGILVWALWDPASRLHTVRAAIVNNDQPVTVGEQLVPLGRQLTAGLVSAPGKTETNYDWIITDSDDAASGLANGDYVAVVTIPKDFSAAATSISGDKPREAVIDVTTSDASKLVDSVISDTVARTAASLSGKQLTETYLDNIYVGFNTLGTQIGQAADGAAQLADGAGKLGDGLGQVGEGVTQLGSGASQLSSGASQLNTGVGALASGADQLSSGARDLSAGTVPLASGAQQIASGLDQLHGGLNGLSQGLTPLKTQGPQLGAGANQTSALVTGNTAVAGQLGALVQECFTTSGASAEFCGKLAKVVGDQKDPNGAITRLAGAEIAINGDGTVKNPGLAAGVNALVDGLTKPQGDNPSAVDGLAALAKASGDLATGAHGLADGAGKLSTGAAGLAQGASGLADGVHKLQTGSSGLADGASKLSTGISQLGEGFTPLTEGATGLEGGATQLADGLKTAVNQLPSYSSQQRETLASVVADPIRTSGGDATSGLGAGLGKQGAPFYAVLALWLGALATFLVLRPLPLGAHGSTRPSPLLALRAFWPGALLGAVQGLLVAAILSPLLKIEFGPWLGFAAIAMLAGVAFAATNQALGALFGGMGKFISMIIAIVVMAGGIIATAPGLLQSAINWFPVGPATDALRAVIGDGSAAGAVVLLVLWTIAGLIVSTLAAARARRRPEPVDARI
ncbi:YhgE/Pip domain-containing protein [Mycetocola tolaasinivorans]|uniref:YhgE/Pip domain-containing protein n=1 Tax=Mycetocola tolaasinivorans TaxID=76635 RepID=A0A3L7A5E5_9MICO|nr:YhgE/Pip domain-containing protein [Mycetocola tolaasinivorans]RLP74542.1 YhgE/Pip domain-containing protein [Mycetocola tolaasinivorans]